MQPMSSSEYRKKMEGVRLFAAGCRYETEHCEQVARLSLRLFDEVEDHLTLNRHDRFLLESGAVLHDIGWDGGQEKHHKRAMRMILEDAAMPLSPEERTLIALVARYHRRALPKAEHPYYPDLEAAQQRKVSLLAGLLRIADGLDRSHVDAVADVTVVFEGDCVSIVCRTKGPAMAELRAAQKKADLLEQALEQPVRICREEE